MYLKSRPKRLLLPACPDQIAPESSCYDAGNRHEQRDCELPACGEDQISCVLALAETTPLCFSRAAGQTADLRCLNCKKFTAPALETVSLV